MTEITPTTLTVPHEVREYTKAGIRQVRAAVADGTLPTIKIGKRRLARIEAVDRWLKSLEGKGIAPKDRRIASRLGAK